MRFLVNANFGPAIAQVFVAHGYETVLASELFGLGYPDDGILEFVAKNGYIVVTKDRGFGRMVYAEGKKHAGIIFIREENQMVAKELLDDLLNSTTDLTGQFVRLP